MDKKITYFLLITLVCCCISREAKSLSGDIWAHDPSSIIKDGNKYWVYTTGDGINACYSVDLFNWKSVGKPVFEKNSWPKWINTYVPNFAGVFWAPDIIKLKNKYCLYYSCSALGSPASVIGMATSPTLDPNSPDYKWTDEGMVVSSASAYDINAIDPSVFLDTDGKLYLTYGSFSDGIGVIELNASSGKVKTGAKLSRVAGGSYSAWEAACLIKEGSYYYLFANRGRCCSGAASTYYIVAGRSKSPRGPFLDKNGISLRGNSEHAGGTTVLISSGRYRGPGHLGLLRDNGRNVVSMHYYDANDNGNPKLDIANLQFSDDGWPVITRDLIPASRFTIVNQNTGMVWEAANCTQPGSQQLVESTDNNSMCQHWDLLPVGDGYYKISNDSRNQSVDVPFCNSSNGTNLQTWTWLNNDCQKFKIEQTANGSYVFTSLSNHAGAKVLQASSTTSSSLTTPISLFDFDGAAMQEWMIKELDSPKALAATAITNNSFTAKWNAVPNATGYKLDVSTSFEDAAYTTIAAWNFQSGTNIASLGIPENLDKTLSSAGTDAPSYNAPGNGGKTAAATGWNSNTAEKFWFVNISTQNYHNIKLSSIQRSSSLGPRHFKVQYKIGEGGAYTDVPGANISNGDDYTSGAIINVALPHDCDNQPAIYIRWLLVTNTNLADEAIQSSGESNIDDIVITGNTGNFVREYNDLSINDTSLVIKDIPPGTNYYYRVRSTENLFTSKNSNTILVRTTGDSPETFTGINAYQNNNTIQVDWSVSSETDVLRYEIEKSVNGLWFSQIGVTEPIGNTPTAQTYHFPDETPGWSENSYRIKVVTKSGVVQYSPIAKAIIEKGQNGVFFFPTPASGNTLQVKLYNRASGKNKLTLFNSLGQQVYKTEINHPGGYVIQTVFLGDNLPRGFYYIVVVNGSNRSVQPIILN